MSKHVNHSPERHGVILDGHDVKRIKDAVAKLGDGYQYVAKTVNNVLDGADLSCAKCPDDCMEPEQRITVPLDVDDRRRCDVCGAVDAPDNRIAVIDGMEDDGRPTRDFACEDAQACGDRVMTDLDAAEERPEP